MLHMIVEQTYRYPMRMEYDAQANSFRESDRRSLAFERGFTKPYGWIKESGTPPQPHWDCILLSDGDFSIGDEVEIEVIGVFELIFPKGEAGRVFSANGLGITLSAYGLLALGIVIYFLFFKKHNTGTNADEE